MVMVMAEMLECQRRHANVTNVVGADSIPTEVRRRGEENESSWLMTDTP
jgi:hypothetical protein